MAGDRHSVISLSELNWITDGIAKAKAAAAAAAKKVEADAAAVKAKIAADAAAAKAAAAAEAAKVKQAAIDAEHKVVNHIKGDIDAIKKLPAAIKACCC